MEKWERRGKPLTTLTRLIACLRLSDIIVGEPIRRGELVPLLMDVHQAEPIALSALYLAGRHRLPKVRVFLDFLIERFGSAPWRHSART